MHLLKKGNNQIVCQEMKLIDIMANMQDIYKKILIHININ